MAASMSVCQSMTASMTMPMIPGGMTGMADVRSDGVRRCSI
jgi:hypothetical protein